MKTTGELEAWHRTLKSIARNYPRKAFWQFFSFFKRELGNPFGKDVGKVAERDFFVDQPRKLQFASYTFP